MLRLLQSNNMQRLVEAFVAEQDTAPANPFEPVSVVVQSFGMGQWLKLQLAQSEGIAANVDCVLPAELIWKMYRLLLDDSLPDTSPFATEKLAWHLMQVLPDCTGHDYGQVQAFLAGTGDSQVRQYQLADKVAALYDQYLVYRPEWINDWQKWVMFDAGSTTGRTEGTQRQPPGKQTFGAGSSAVLHLRAKCTGRDCTRRSCNSSNH